MVKKIFSLLMLLVCIFSVQAQGMPEMPLNPKVKHGKLPNGLNYYIMHNEEPKGRANFYIAQKVGSTLETKEQLGLAHFLEHMAFNGSTNFPGKAMINYLEAKGINFGGDINAYTSFDETVYRINNVPTSDQALMDSVLLVLHDWSGDLLLEDAEIDAERGVIQEEWRQRNGVQSRMINQLLPQLYQEYNYTQTPIGSMDVVMNFPYQVLRDYYDKWYRPDQQGIVIVGDVDVAAMEKKVIDMFTPITMPENPAERVYPHVSDNDDMIYATFVDPEQQNMVIIMSIKSDVTPFEERSSMGYYMETKVAEPLIETMMNSRLQEISQNADCAFAYAAVGFGDYWVSKTKAAFDIQVIPKTDPKAAFDQAFSEVVRMCKTGFTESELQRAKDELKTSFEKTYNERDKTNNDGMAQKIIRYFIDNKPNVGIEQEWPMIQQLLPMIPLEAFNEAVKDIITPNNQVVVVMMPDAQKELLPSKEEMVQIINSNLGKEFETYVDDVIEGPLVAKLPKKGKVVKEEALPQFGATKLTLSNGAVVLLKTTDFAADEILYSATANFGMNAFPQSEAANLFVLGEAYESSDLGNFNTTQLTKALAGKNVGTAYSMESNTSGFEGVSSVKDLETLMQLIYLQFTDVRANNDMYATQVDRMVNILANTENTPNYQWSKALQSTIYNNNPLYDLPTSDTYRKANYEAMLKMAKENLANAADYDFIFVGNVDVATLKPLLEQYIAPLKGNAKKAGTRKNEKYQMARGQVTNEFELPMESPQVKEFVCISGDNVPYTLENQIKMSFVSNILDIIYFKSLREEIGGTYGASSYATINPRTGLWQLIYAYDTGDETKKALADRAASDLNNLLQNGASAEDFNKVKEQALSRYSLNVKQNKYWMGVLESYALLGNDNYSQKEEIIRNLTLDELNAFMKNLYNGENSIHVVLNGVAK